MSEEAVKKSDLGVRTVSAVVMIIVAGGALLLGGWFWKAFVSLIALGVLWEFFGLVKKIAKSWWSTTLWLIGGVVYVGTACLFLIDIRDDVSDVSHPLNGLMTALRIILPVIFVDVGAYFAGRTLGGPKIAPSISPSKTWAGLAGGTVAAAIVISILSFVMDRFFRGENSWPEAFNGYPFLEWHHHLTFGLFLGLVFAVTAQVGDFFESWMKRRAGVKDSGNLIPGHGGLFDRVDGLIAVCFVLPVLWFVTT